MKTFNQIFAAIFFSMIVSAAIAATPTWSYFAPNGSITEIPVIEEATENIPAEIAAALAAEQQAEREMLISQLFDISQMSVPEAGADNQMTETINLSIPTECVYYTMMTFHGPDGYLAEFPVVIEEATDQIPAAIATALSAEQKAEREMLISQQFDISHMSVTETATDDVVINTCFVFHLFI